MGCPPPTGLLSSVTSGVWTTVLCSQDMWEMTHGRLPLSGAEKGKESVGCLWSPLGRLAMLPPPSP